MDDDYDDMENKEIFEEIKKEDKRELPRRIEEEKIWNNEDIDEILNPSCSEQVFKLSGDLETIKEEVMNMIQVVEKDNFPPDKKSINKLKKKIENISNLKEFEDNFPEISL